MDDTEMINWAQANLKELHQDLMGLFEMKWIDKDGIYHYTLGVNLRDCIRGAIAAGLGPAKEK